MVKSRKIKFGIIAAVVIVVAGLLTAQSGVIENFSEATRQVQTVEVSGDLAIQYKSVDELKRNAEIIVRVKAEKVKSLTFQNTVFTVSTNDVQKVYKGTSVPSTLKVLETGGLIGDKNYVFESSPVLSPGEEAVLFLERYDGPITNDAYVVLGAFQGKFNATGEELTPQKNSHESLIRVHSIRDFDL